MIPMNSIEDAARQAGSLSHAQFNFVKTEPLRKALEFGAPAIRELKPLSCGELPDYFGCQNLSGSGARADTGGGVDSATKQIAVAHQRLAGVQSDAHAHRRSHRRRILSCEGGLDRERATNGTCCGEKCAQEPVAGVVHFRAVVLPQAGANYCIVLLQKRAGPLIAEPFEYAGR